MKNTEGPPPAFEGYDRYISQHNFHVLMSDVLEREYSITQGSLVKGVTWFVIILFICIGILIPWSIYYFDNNIIVALLLLIIFIIIFSAILGGSWVYSPQKYLLSDQEIKIIRPASSIVIPFSKVSDVEDKDINVFKTIRVLGNGGLFAFTGTFYNKVDGKFVMYTKNNNYIMIHTKDKKYVLSPDEKELFIIELKNKMMKINNEGR